MSVGNKFHINLIEHFQLNYRQQHLRLVHQSLVQCYTAITVLYIKSKIWCEIRLAVDMAVHQILTKQTHPIV